VKRFWKSVGIEQEDDRWGVRLDGRQVRTPARSVLVVAGARLAEAIADEWRGVEDRVDPAAMPLTGIANAAIDLVTPDPKTFAAGLARYAETDLACYRSEWPPDLVRLQAESWDPLLAWARRRYDVDFSTTTGLMHVPQPPATVERLAHAVNALNAFQLAGISPLVTIGGSLVAALGVIEKAIPAGDAWQAVSVDERWQLEQWGADPEGRLAMDNRRADFIAGAQFLELIEA